MYACAGGPAHAFIDDGPADWSTGLTEHLIERLLFAVKNNVADSRHEKTQQRIKNCIRRHGGSTTKSNVCQAVRSVKREGAIDDLVEMGELRREIRNGRGSRPVEMLILVDAQPTL